MNTTEMLQKFNTIMDEYLSKDNPVSEEMRRYYLNSRNRYQFVISRLPKEIEGKKVLDVGISKFTFLLKEICPHIDLTAMDFHNEEGLEEHGIKYLSHNLEKDGDLPEEMFDIIIFGEVLEHLAVSPRFVLAKFHRMLKKGGLLLATTPNFLSLGNRMKFIAGRNPLERIRKDLSNPGHFREYSMDELTDYFKDVGFNIIKAEFPDYWNDPGVHLQLYKMDRVNPVKMYFIYLPFVLFKKTVSIFFPSTRYGLFIVGEK